MIPLLIMLGAMALGILAPQVERLRAMKGVFVPPGIQQQDPELMVPENVSPLEGHVCAGCEETTAKN